jgi:hypothetical protein
LKEKERKEGRDISGKTINFWAILGFKHAVFSFEELSYVPGVTLPGYSYPIL